MSHYLLKLKESWSNYLAELPDYNTPRWRARKIAKRFATAADARAYLKALHDRGLDYPAHVVYLRTADDLKAERKALRSRLIRVVAAAKAVIGYEWGGIAPPEHQPLWCNLEEECK